MGKTKKEELEIGPVLEPVVPKYKSKNGNIYFRPPIRNRLAAPPNVVRAHQNAEDDQEYRWRMCFNCRAVDCHPTSVCCWKSFCSKCNKEGSHTDKYCRGTTSFPPPPCDVVVDVSFLEAINQMSPTLVCLLLDKNYGDQIANTMRRLASNRASKANTNEEIAEIIRQINRASLEGVGCAIANVQSAEVKTPCAGVKNPCAGTKNPSAGVENLGAEVKKQPAGAKKIVCRCEGPVF